MTFGFRENSKKKTAPTYATRRWVKLISHSEYQIPIRAESFTHGLNPEVDSKGQ